MKTQQLDRIYIVNELRRYAHPSIYHSLLQLSTEALHGVLTFYEHGGSSADIIKHQNDIQRGLNCSYLMGLDFATRSIIACELERTSERMMALREVRGRSRGTTPTFIVAIIWLLVLLIAGTMLYLIFDALNVSDFIQGMFITHLR